MGERAYNIANAVSNTLGMFGQMSMQRDERQLEEIRERRRMMLQAQMNRENFQMEREARREDSIASEERAARRADEVAAREAERRSKELESDRAYRSKESEAERRFRAEEGEKQRAASIEAARIRSSTDDEQRNAERSATVVRKYNERLSKLESDFAVSDKPQAFLSNLGGEINALRAGEASTAEVTAIAASTIEALNRVDPENRKKNVETVKQMLMEAGYQVGKPQTETPANPDADRSGVPDSIQKDAMPTAPTPEDLFGTQPVTGDDDVYAGQIALRYLDGGDQSLTPLEKATIEAMRLQPSRTLEQRYGLTREQILRLKRKQ